MTLNKILLNNTNGVMQGQVNGVVDFLILVYCELGAGWTEVIIKTTY